MTKIQVDIPDAWLDDLRRSFRKRIGSTEIPIANRHLVHWCIEQYMKGASNAPETSQTGDPVGIPENIPDPRGTPEESPRDSPHERTQSLEEILDEIDRHAAANAETSV